MEDSSLSVDEALLRDIFTLSSKVGSVPFPMVVHASAGFRVIPIYTSNASDKNLIVTLKKILDAYLQTLEKTHYRLEGDRPNEVGSRIEGGLVHEMTRSSLKVKKLSQKGYPDIEIEHEDRLSYLEVKVSSTVEPSDLRYFYYSSGEKIKGDARHLLVNIGIARLQNTNNIWKVGKCVISDLSKLVVKLKAEFNASQKDISAKSMELFSCEL